jgi:nitrite reductase/ring-hydroxylating ferredoxin subunit
VSWGFLSRTHGRGQVDRAPRVDRAYNDTMDATIERHVRAASVAEVEAAGRLPVQLEGHAVVLFADRGQIRAVDNRCPHMGFPLHRGSLKDGILTCHWHHARFDLASGGTFDLWADDVRTFPVLVRDGDVWIDLAPPDGVRAHQRQRLRDGLERELTQVVAKAVITLLASGDEPAEPFRIGLEFGTRYRQGGWGQGLTILTCLMNLVPHVEAADHSRALYQGLAAVARDTAGSAPRFAVRPLPAAPKDIPMLRRWFRRFVEVRDAEGAERCLVSALQTGGGRAEIAEMMLAAATDHRYIEGGHALDFTNKAFEALDAAGWEYAAPVLTALASGLANADRMEESNEWRNPIDLVEIIENAAEQIPATLESGRARRGAFAAPESLVPVLLGEDPQAIADGLLEALRHGATETELAGIVAYASARRIAHFHTSNEFGDWDTALHTFTFANAVQQMLRRGPSADGLRGVFDAAMSVYLDRFLNVPPAPLPSADAAAGASPDGLRRDLAGLLDRQQQVNEAGTLVAQFLAAGGDPAVVRAALGGLLLREDRNFHTIQCLDAAFRQSQLLAGTPQATHVLVAAARYLAAHAPTMRAQEQTYTIALRLHRGEKLYED